MIGDSIETDIMMAKNAEIDSTLVFTGQTLEELLMDSLNQHSHGLGG